MWHIGKKSDPVQTVVFLGSLQVGQLAAWAADWCPEGTIIVQGAPHWIADTNGSDIATYVHSFTVSALDEILTQYAITKVRIIAESQAVPCVLTIFSQPPYSMYVNQITLLQPLGLNPQAYSGTAVKRLAIFQRRILRNAVYQLAALVRDRRLRHNHHFLSKTIDLRDARIRAHYANGLACNALPNLKRVVDRTIPVSIICGDHDMLFPRSEIAAACAPIAPEVTIRSVKGVPHSPLGTRHGHRLLAAAFEI